jgi:exopolyphosphatase/guanosine-5'-triphosphate,3'-diphosphate pyrophosphatase
MTSAVRDAANGAEFAAAVHERHGLDGHTLSGDEEARLTFLGATASRDGSGGGSLLVVDIGGGSTELVVGAGGEVRFHVSTQAGVVRHTERHLASDPPAPAELEALADDVRAVLEAAVPAAERDDPAFRLKVGLRLLRQAGVEYGEAAEDNFASPQEYRHARGFLLAAQDWLAPVRDRLAASEPETARAIADALDTLARALPSWDPPQQPIRDPGEVSGAISRLEFAAAALL